MDKQVATLGWCMGGSWSFTATLLAGNNAVACVMYYGFPEKEAKKIQTLQTDILYIWGTQDKYITKRVVDEFGQQVRATGHKFEVHDFDAVHAFANPSNPKHDALASKQAEAITLKFFKAKLQMD
jgi:carboxymethylenebutenolidase